MAQSCTDTRTNGQRWVRTVDVKKRYAACPGNADDDDGDAQQDKDGARDFRGFLGHQKRLTEGSNQISVM